MPVIYPINLCEKRDYYGNIDFDIAPIMSDNDGHRRVPAWAVPDSEVPLVCSDSEWEMIKRRERERLGIRLVTDVAELPQEPLLRPRNRDSSYNCGYVRETRAGAWVERRMCSMCSGGCNILVLPREVDTETGEELRPYVRMSDTEWDGENILYDPQDKRYMVRHASRADNMRSVRETCNKFKWMVRANEYFVRLFLTLTYADNMRDTKRLYEDFRRFFARLSRAVPDISGYLCACEPQKRGAWHMHVLLLSRKKSLYISNRRVCSLWGRGFTKVQRCRNVRDVGLYLTSYLSNIKDGKGTKKGARLALYPLGFRFTRWSRSCRLPSVSAFRGCFGDKFKHLDCYILCYDYQNEKRTEDGKKIVSRISLFYKEIPK